MGGQWWVENIESLVPPGVLRPILWSLNSVMMANAGQIFPLYLNPCYTAMLSVKPSHESIDLKQAHYNFQDLEYLFIGNCFRLRVRLEAVD
jgi:hypothetical protein